MILLEEQTVPASFADARLMDFANRSFDVFPSRTAAKKAIKRGEVLLDGVVSDPFTILQKGQKVSLIDLEMAPPGAYEINLEILFEDEYLSVVYKPAGLPVSGNRHNTMVNALSFNLKTSSATDALKWPKPVHRLDIPTQGLLVVAKTATALMLLGKQFQERKVKKRYRAVVAGKTPPRGTINDPVHEQEAVTKYETIKQIPSLKTGYLSLVDLFPATGRRHQLRIHLSRLGHPIVGDKTYTTQHPLLKGKGLFLCAVELEFDHPILDLKVHVHCNHPEKFDALLGREEERWKKYHC